MIRAAHFVSAYGGFEKIRHSLAHLALRGRDADAPPETLYSRMREGGKSADAPESPDIFRTKCTAHMLHTIIILTQHHFPAFIANFHI